MNPLLAQFVTESRDLLEQASRALLQLEERPGESAAMDALFRAVHTVKGSSGLFEIPPFTEAVHAGEDLLDAVREGDVHFGADLADLLLETLDQVAEWLSELEATGELNPGAEAIGRALSERLRARLLDPVEEQVVDERVTMEGAVWPDDAPATVRSLPGPLHLVRYDPDPQVFYSGDDPLLTVMTTPDLRWIGAREPAQWPSLEAMDPFAATMGFAAVSGADREELEAHYLYVSDQVTIASLPSSVQASASDSAVALKPELADEALALVASQRRLLAAPGTEDRRNARIGAAAEVLLRIAHAAGATSIAAAIRAVDPAASGAETRLDRLAERLGDAVLADPAHLPPRPPEPEVDAGTDRAAIAPRKSTAIRVDAERIDHLMNLAGELIVAKNALPFLARKAEEIAGGRALSREIKAQHDSINRIAEELQAAVMQIRMVPVGTVLSRFNRLVRDLARKLDKRIRLVTEGEETEADKSVVEELADPMVHLIRNAIDHGLELPADRRAAGKPEEGTIRLSASQRDDSVVIEVSDDGRGIDVERVKARALDKGVVDRAGLERMTDEAALQLILAPGLSTRDEISDLSGRGVGMDVVASMVRRVGGTILIESTPGQGTTVRVALPLSMAVQRLMMVEVDHGLYGIPVEAVVESQRLPPSAVHRHRDDEIVQLRDRIIPLLRLRPLFGCPPDPGQQDLNLMIVEVDGNEVGLVVDRFHAGVDAIVKPMEGILGTAGCFSGTALLGDGSVLLALDLPEVLACRWK